MQALLLGDGERPAGIYEARAASLDQSAWSQILARFDDASLYQTWAYGDTRWGSGRLHHHILTREGNIVAAAQVARITLPVIGAGVAVVKWGPMWRPARSVPNVEDFREMLRHLGRHYAHRLVLRIEPRVIDDRSGVFQSMLAAEGFHYRRFPITYKTYLMDLSEDVETLRGRLKKSWRRHLCAAEQLDLLIVELQGETGVARFVDLHRELRRRKRFVDETGIDLFSAYQAALPDAQKLKLFACMHGDIELAVFAVSVMGDTAMTLFAVTTPEGRRRGASHLLDWWIVDYLKKRGCRWYDIGGAGNPVIDQYKSGLAGRAVDIEAFIGYFDKSSNLLSQLTVTLGGTLRRRLLKFRKWLAKAVDRARMSLLDQRRPFTGGAVGHGVLRDS